MEKESRHDVPCLLPVSRMLSSPNNPLHLENFSSKISSPGAPSLSAPASPHGDTGRDGIKEGGGDGYTPQSPNVPASARDSFSWVETCVDPTLPSGSPCGSCSSWAHKAVGTCVLPIKPTTNPWSLVPLKDQEVPYLPRPSLIAISHLPSTFQVDFACSTTN